MTTKKEKVLKLSSTRINTFLQCKLKYWYNYFEHLPKLENPAFKLGLAVHESLELAGHKWMERGLFNEEDTKEILDVFDKVAIREGIENLSVYQEGRRLVQNRLNEFDLGKGIISLEYRFGDNGGADVVTEEGVYLVGAMDKVIEVDEDTLLIVDYKTSKTIPTSDQLKSDIQLSIYDVAASMKWPKYKRNILALDLLKSEILYTYRTNESRQLFKHYLKNLRDAMAVFDKKEAIASLNMFCPWCDYKDYCPTYKEACEKSDYKFLSVLNYTSGELIKEWKTVRDTKKILEERERELSMIMIEKIKKDGANLLNGSEEIYIRQNSRTNYDLGTVSGIIPHEELMGLVSLNKKSVEEYMDENPSVKEKIEASAQTNYTTPFLAVKKIKE